MTILDPDKPKHAAADGRLKSEPVGSRSVRWPGAYGPGRTDDGRRYLARRLAGTQNQA